MSLGGVLDTGHAFGIKARVVAGTFPEAQKVRLDLVSEIRGHFLGVLAEVAHTGLDVGACKGNPVDHYLGVEPAVELAHLGLQAGTGCRYLVGGEQLVPCEPVVGMLCGLLGYRCHLIFTA